MDCPGGHDVAADYTGGREASTLVLMDCPGGLGWRKAIRVATKLQPLF